MMTRKTLRARITAAGLVPRGGQLARDMVVSRMVRLRVGPEDEPDPWSAELAYRDHATEASVAADIKRLMADREAMRSHYKRPGNPVTRWLDARESLVRSVMSDTGVMAVSKAPMQRWIGSSSTFNAKMLEFGLAPLDRAGRG